MSEEAVEPAEAPAAGPLRLRLYVCGNAPNSTAARRNLGLILGHPFAGRSEVEIIDVVVDRARAVQDQVLVTPMLVRADAPHVRVLGNLADTASVLAALHLHA